MATTNQDSPEILCEEILADARRESGDIVQRARQEAAEVLAGAAMEANKARQERLGQAGAEAARRTELIRATVAIETGRLRAARSEALLQSIYQAVQQRLSDRAGADRRETLLALAVDAVRRMAGDAFVVRLSAADSMAFGDGLAGEILRRVDRHPLNITISPDPAITEGGLIVADPEGRQVWDNRLSARLQRLWPELRRRIAVDASLLGAPASKGGAE